MFKYIEKFFPYIGTLFGPLVYSIINVGFNFSELNKANNFAFNSTCYSIFIQVLIYIGCFIYKHYSSTITVLISKDGDLIGVDEKREVLIASVNQIGKIYIKISVKSSMKKVKNSQVNINLPYSFEITSVSDTKAIFSDTTAKINISDVVNSNVKRSEDLSREYIITYMTVDDVKSTSAVSIEIVNKPWYTRFKSNKLKIK